MNGMTTIYALCDPVTSEIRYIGKTVSSLRIRLASHMHCAKSLADICYRSCWIRSLSSRPHIIPLLVVPDTEGSSTEIRVIAGMRSAGVRLTNLTDGGEGVVGYVKSPELRAQMSAIRKGRKMSEEQKAKISTTNRGKKRTAEFCARMSARKSSPETRAKNSAAAKLRVGSLNPMFGKHRSMSQETREKISASMLGRKWTPEQYEKMVGRKNTPETIERMRQAALRRAPRKRQA